MSRVDMQNGDLVRDRVTGFEGIVVCVSHWLNGCVRLTVQPRALKDSGEVRQTETFDVEQLERVTANAYGYQHTPTGGPMPSPPRGR